MESKDRQPIATLESQWLICSEECEDRNCAARPYRPPQVFYVGKAKRLMAGLLAGNALDTSLRYIYM